MVEQACEQEHPPGCLKIAIVYRLGHGVAADPAAARGYFERACERGVSEDCKWSSRGIRCVLVHSDSPIWEARIRNTWLPRFGPSVDTQNRPLMDS